MPKAGDPPADPPKAPDPAVPPNELVGAPEAYEDFTLPEGMTLSDETKTEVQALFKEVNLSQKGAQKLLDTYAKQSQDIVQSMIDKSNEQRAAWREEVKKLPDIGQNLLAVKEQIGKMFTAWNDAALVAGFKEAMDKTGVGDHPAMIRVLHMMSKHYTEGTPVSPKGPVSPAQQKSAAQIMYPNNPSSAAG